MYITEIIKNMKLSYYNIIIIKIQTFTQQDLTMQYYRTQIKLHIIQCALDIIHTHRK